MAKPSDSSQVPLAVDLDGTLIRTDMLWESIVRLLKLNPAAALAIPFWWMGGRANLKQQVAARVEVDPTSLPYHEEFLAWLKLEKQKNRRLVLATASDIKMAAPVAQHVGIFDEVLASDGKTNLRSTAKMNELTKRFGERGFDYAGNSPVDLGVWVGSREAVVVNAGENLVRRAEKVTHVGQKFLAQDSFLTDIVRCLRPHQWVKNLIVFVPLLTSHQITQGPLLLQAVWAFIAFSLCASGVYVFNDLIDLEADRHHLTKRRRPFAAGNLPIQVGLVLSPLLLIGAVLVAASLPPRFLAVLGIYFLMTTLYSWRLKREPVVDVFVLAGLYTMRLIGGHVVTGIAYSAWLLIFSMFTFLSLSLLKRFIELQSVRQQNLVEVKGRGYTARDLELISTFGMVCSCLAVLVLALYVTSPQVIILYENQNWLLLVCPLLLFWLTRIWFLAHRGQIDDDPTQFAVKDWSSYLIGALTLAIIWSTKR